VRPSRNLTDAELRGIAATGGVVGLNFHAPFVVRGRPALLADVVRQAKYLVKWRAWSTSRSGRISKGYPSGAGAFGREPLPGSANALERAGLGEAAVRKLFSENALRVLCRSGK